MIDQKTTTDHAQGILAGGADHVPDAGKMIQQSTSCWRRLWDWLSGRDVVRDYEAAHRQAAARAVAMLDNG